MAARLICSGSVAVALLAVVALAPSGRVAAAAAKPCPAGTVSALIAKHDLCLKRGQACKQGLNAQYRRHGFLCSPAGRLGPIVATPSLPQPRNVTIVVAGQPQTVFSWAKDRCEDLDIPDLSARAFRDAQGRVQLIAAHYINRRFIGPDFDHLTHDCSVILRSDLNPDPSAYDDHEWISATYTPDGQTVYALIHDEYQGFEHPGQCTNFSDVGWCLQTSLTLAVSTDDGNTYQHATPPALVASFPFRYVPDAGNAGARDPSNIVHNERDGYYYAIVNVVQGKPGQPLAVNRDCLIRTNDLSDPSSWRAWSGGTNFDTSFIDPYRSTADPAAHLCAAVAPDVLDSALGSLTYSTYARQWILVEVNGGGFYYSLSPDLIHWSGRNLFYPAIVPWTYTCGGPDPVHYPLLIDPNSTSRNFDTMGKTAYLYFTQFHTEGCNQGLNRDLMRVPIVLK